MWRAVAVKIYSVVNPSRRDTMRRNETIDGDFSGAPGQGRSPAALSCRRDFAFHFLIGRKFRTCFSPRVATTRPVSSRLVSFMSALPFLARYALPIKPAIVKPQLTNAENGPGARLSRLIDLSWPRDRPLWYIQINRSTRDKLPRHARWRAVYSNTWQSWTKLTFHVFRIRINSVDRPSSSFNILTIGGI